MSGAGAGAGDLATRRAFAEARLWVTDLDGVIWLTGEAIGDAPGAVAELRSRGVRVLFATNNSAPTAADLIGRLDRIGIAAEPGDLASSAHAAAGLFNPGQTVRLLAGAGVREALDERGVMAAEEGPVDAAVVGWTRTFDFDSVSTTAAAARQSGRLVGTNDDPTHPTPDGLVPGSGAILAAVATASGIVAEVAGKPHQPMADLMEQRFGFGAGDPSVVMVGDQPGTDGRLAQRLGLPFALVDSGVTRPDASAGDVPVALRAQDFEHLVAQVLASHR